MATFMEVESVQSGEIYHPLREENAEEQDFIQRYRFDRSGIEFIANLVKEDLTPKDSRGGPIPADSSWRKFGQKFRKSRNMHF